MRVLQVCSAKTIGGGERHVLDLCLGLAESGHEVHLAVRPDGDLAKALPKTGIQVHLIPIRNSADIAGALKLRRIIKRNRIEIVHAHVGRDYLPSAFAARWLQAALVLTRHHYYPFRAGPFYESLIGNARLVIAVSRSVAEGISDAFPGLANRVRVIPNWLAGSEPLSREEARRQLGIRAELAVGMIGEITQIKGQKLTAGSFARLPEELRARSELVLIGRSSNTEYRQDIEEAWPETRFLGELNDAAALASAFDVLVVASQGEGFSLAAIEGMRAGTALACSRTPALEELVREGETGRFFDFEGSSCTLSRVLEDLLRNPEAREELGSNARREATERFNRGRILGLIQAEYEKLAKSRTSSN